MFMPFKAPNTGDSRPQPKAPLKNWEVILSCSREWVKLADTKLYVVEAVTQDDRGDVFYRLASGTKSHRKPIAKFLEQFAPRNI